MYLVFQHRASSQRHHDGDSVGEAVGDAHQSAREVRRHVDVHQLEPSNLTSEACLSTFTFKHLLLGTAPATFLQ